MQLQCTDSDDDQKYIEKCKERLEYCKNNSDEYGDLPVTEVQIGQHIRCNIYKGWYAIKANIFSNFSKTFYFFFWFFGFF